MPLSPETRTALVEALDAVIDEAADDPELAELVDTLSQAKAAVPVDEAAEPPLDEEAAEEVADVEEPPADVEDDDDPYSFDAAEKKHVARRKATKGENPFAEGAA